MAQKQENQLNNFSVSKDVYLNLKKMTQCYGNIDMLTAML